MSKKGIQIAAKVFEHMQRARMELLALGCGDVHRDADGRSSNPTAKTKSGHQDILLGQLFQNANDAVKDEFSRITMMSASMKGTVQR